MLDVLYIVSCQLHNIKASPVSSTNSILLFNMVYLVLLGKQTKSINVSTL